MQLVTGQPTRHLTYNGARRSTNTQMMPAHAAGALGQTPYEKGEELPCSEWGLLEEGVYVLVERDTGQLLGGEVDDLTHDASVFWLWLDGGRGRIALYNDERIRVWLPRGCSLRPSEDPSERVF